MRFREVVPGLRRAARGGVNVHLIEHGEGLVLVDAGTPRMARPILEGLASDPGLHGRPLCAVLLTHGHHDHAGGAAEVARATGAAVWAHPADLALLAEGRWRRPYRPSPTLHGRVLTRLVADRFPERLPPVIGVRAMGETVPVAGGIEVWPTPGHAAGHVALGWTALDGRRVVFAGDVVTNVAGLREPILYEDRAEGLRSIGRLADLAAGADVVAFGHGLPRPVTPRLVMRLRRLARGELGRCVPRR